MGDQPGRLGDLLVMVRCPKGTLKIFLEHSLDVTSPRPRKTTIAFFAYFGGIEKLFCTPDQCLNSKIMNQCNIDFNFLEKKVQKFHFIGTINGWPFNVFGCIKCISLTNLICKIILNYQSKNKPRLVTLINSYKWSILNW